jgi:hypothetical protein
MLARAWLVPLVGLAAVGSPALAVRAGGAWVSWWRADQAPARWTAPAPAMANTVRWSAASPGVEWGELTLSGAGEAWRVRLVLVRLDPARVRLRPHLADTRGARGAAWSLDSVPADVPLALNGGQFTDDGPWGWLVRDGVELHAPGTGPMSAALVVDTAGGMRLVPPDSIAGLRGDPAVAQAFQSYPALLTGDGDVPAALRTAGSGVSLAHRDARLAVGELRDGRILLALTRFEGLGGVLSNLPFGFTTPEMAAVMGALGCRRALLLDGGISSQLLLRTPDGKTHTWSGMRRVAVGLTVTPR